jgi:hypothetical protein
MAYYFFGNTEGLFSGSVLTGPAHPLHQLATLLVEGTEQIGPRLVRRLLERWEKDDALSRCLRYCVPRLSSLSRERCCTTLSPVR